MEGPEKEDNKDTFAHAHLHLRMALMYSFPVKVRAGI